MVLHELDLPRLFPEKGPGMGRAGVTMATLLCPDIQMLVCFLP